MPDLTDGRRPCYPFPLSLRGWGMAMGDTELPTKLPHAARVALLFCVPFIPALVAADDLNSGAYLKAVVWAAGAVLSFLLVFFWTKSAAGASEAPLHDFRNARAPEGSTGLLVSGKDNTFHNIEVAGFDRAIHLTPEAERNQFSKVRTAQEPGERGDVVFKDGLLRLLEAVDGTDYGDVIRGTNQGDDALMGYFAASLLLRGHDDRPEVAIYGKREPARVSRRIPDGELGRLDWDNRREQLKSAHAAEPVRFSAVTLDAAQFEKHLAWYLARANRLGDSAL